MIDSTSIAIIGAGPYGLSLAAHLSAQKIDFRVFGSPMSYWRTHMPRGMLLKSEGDASNLYDPDHQLTLKRFCSASGIAYQNSGLPVGLDTFCAYGLDFQKRLVPQLDERLVTSLSRSTNGYRLVLEDGTAVLAGRVVVAVGVGYFSYLPDNLAQLPDRLVSHSSHYGDLSVLHGKEIVVLGGGASALDLAALLHRESISVRLVARAKSLDIHSGPTGKSRPWSQRIRHPRSGIGNSMRSLMLARAPLAFHYLPEAMRLRITRDHLGPAGGWFIKDQVGRVPTLLGCSVQQAEVHNSGVRLFCKYANNTPIELKADHVIAATGYRVDLRRLRFLDKSLLSAIRAVEHSPVLSSCFESSVTGIYFVGPAAANSFGSVLRFAYGARFTAKRLTAHLSRALRRKPAHGEPSHEVDGLASGSAPISDATRH